MNKRVLTGIVAAVVAAVAVIVILIFMNLFNDMKNGTNANETSAESMPYVQPIAPVEEREDDSETGEVIDTTTEYVFTGTLTDVSLNTITLKGAKDELTFNIKDAQITYIDDHFEYGDTIYVRYTHDENNNNIAKTVKVSKRPEEELLTCKGTIKAVDQNEITMSTTGGDKKFLFDSETVIDGTLNIGNEAELSYRENGTGDPIARKIKITKVKVQTYTIKGEITQVSDTSITVKMSDKSKKTIKITSETYIEGTLKKGLTVSVKYQVRDEGTIATNITVTKTSETKSVTGTVVSVSDSSLTIKSGDSQYKITINSDTDISGISKPTKGCTAQVKYTGDLKSGAVAKSIVYKKASTTPTKTPTPTPTKTPTPTPTKTPEPTNTPEPTKTPAPTKTPTPEPTNTPEPTDTPEPEPTDTPEPEPTDTPEPDPSESEETES